MIRQRLTEIVKNSQKDAGTFKFAYWIGGAVPKGDKSANFFVTGKRKLKLYHSNTGRSTTKDSRLVRESTPSLAVDDFEKCILSEA
jgi:hypothetical protein